MAAAPTTVDPAFAAAAGVRSSGAACSLAEILDRILHLGVSLEGNVTISVADVDLLYLDLRLLLASVDTVWPEGRPSSFMAPTPDEALPPPRPSSAPPPDRPIGASIAAGAEPSAIAAGAAAPFASPASPPTPVAGLVRLVLTLVELLHDVLERQAVRRMDGGNLTASQIENVGAALLAQAAEIERLRQNFGLSERDLPLRFDLSDRSV